jgi:hypothetical protein
VSEVILCERERAARWAAGSSFDRNADHTRLRLTPLEEAAFTPRQREVASRSLMQAAIQDLET